MSSLKKPFVFINAAMSLDGKLSTFERKQVRISNDLDLKRVDKLRAESDAILVGMKTVLIDDPKLTIKSRRLREMRKKLGKPENPMKVTIGNPTKLDPECEFLNYGNSKVVIFASKNSDREKIEILKKKAKIFLFDEEKISLRKVMDILYSLGVRKLMVEGGGTLNFELIKEALVDEISVAIAPKIFGGKNAPTLVDGSGFPYERHIRLIPKSLEFLDGVYVLTYKLLYD